jgi:8-oxo-dGTP diphosphatase
MGIGGQQVTIVVDVANVMGSRPDGWWRDRPGAAVRLHDEIVRLVQSGRAILPDGPDASGPGFVMVLEGAARAAASRLPAAEPDPDRDPDTDGTGPARPAEVQPREVQPGEVRVVQARGSGDDAIVAVVRELPGRRAVVTADRELRARCVAAGAEILGPGWLLGLLRG